MDSSILYRIRENVKLHLPIRMALNVQLCDKILKSAEAKAAEAKQGNQGNGNGRGRAQVRSSWFTSHRSFAYVSRTDSEPALDR